MEDVNKEGRSLVTSFISPLPSSLLTFPALPSPSPLSAHPPAPPLVFPAFRSSSPPSPHLPRFPLILAALPSSFPLFSHLLRSPLIPPSLPSPPQHPLHIIAALSCSFLHAHPHLPPLTHPSFPLFPPPSCFPFFRLTLRLLPSPIPELRPCSRLVSLPSTS
ncbi:unnamed protein product [Closterium sp. Naga37s-1]|nr:unnamed protein product [Closterium sp. Naga37s-1]